MEHIVPTSKQLSSLQAIGELMTSSNHYFIFNWQNLFHLALIYAISYFQIKLI